MNEQLIVKNFGPIKDATVDFKQVTVFIGPTGGGKSTLAKLVAIFRGDNFFGAKPDVRKKQFESFALSNFFLPDSWFHWAEDGGYESYVIEADLTQLETFVDNNRNIKGQFLSETKHQSRGELVRGIIQKSDYAGIKKAIESYLGGEQAIDPNLLQVFKQLEHLVIESFQLPQPAYFPSNRALVPAVEYSWAGLLRDDIGLPKDTLEFANNFSLSRKNVSELEIPFLNAKYIHQNGQDFIKIPESETLFRLYETASGIQSVTPLLVLLEHLSRNTEQAQSFIIEEPELNLFPLAQFELVKILVEKCAQLDGKNDLVLTTHSPYVLTAFNLLCYAYRIAQQDEATAKKVAKLIPRHCWIDPDQFAAYYVDRPDTKRKQQVRSIINKKTGLIEENELDTASDELGSLFDKLVKLRKPTATPARTK
jgi:predicted ATPase